MILQMWEPHQTSAFLNAFFIHIYLSFTGTTTGIALYLNLVGLLAKLGVAFLVYRSFLHCCSEKVLFFICAFFMTVNAKRYLLLEFSNMMIYFSILLCCTLYTYFRKQENSWRVTYLVLAAFCFCLEVLSYPSTVILFPLFLGYLVRYSVHKRRDVVLFSAVCAVTGGLFLGCLLMQTGWERFLYCAEHILMGDSAHQVGRFSEQLKVYASDIGLIAVIFAACALLAFLIVKSMMFKGIVSSKSWYIKMFFILLLAENFCQALVRVNDDFVQLRPFYSAVYIPILVLGIGLRRYCCGKERMLFDIGAGISICGCVAVLLLTNLSFLTTAAYLIPGVMVSMAPIGRYLQQVNAGFAARTYRILILFMAVVIFQNLYVFRSLAYEDATIPYIRSVVKSGPMMGIFSDYMGGYIRNNNLEQWKQYVKKDDKVLIVGLPVSTIGYLYEDVEICTDSTISTPTYDEKLLAYWELNPQKEPDVVVLDCWFGEPRISRDTWIMQWIEDNFETYVDGTYIRVYRRDEM